MPGDVRLAVALPRFDGPFDLLISLIRRREYPMDRLPVAAITAEFLAYIRDAEALDMDLGGEFLETASWLVLLKSRSLLPREEPAEARRELGEAVREYQMDRELLDQTKEKLESLRRKRQRVCAPGAARARRAEEAAEEPALTAADVVRKVRGAIASARARAAFETKEATAVTVADQKEWILTRLAQVPAGTAVSTAPWFTAQNSPASRAGLLLALLELTRTLKIIVHQRLALGAICAKSRSCDKPME